MSYHASANKFIQNGEVSFTKFVNDFTRQREEAAKKLVEEMHESIHAASLRVPDEIEWEQIWDTIPDDAQPNEIIARMTLVINERRTKIESDDEAHRHEIADLRSGGCK
jgi:hypothetical protein